MEEARLQAAYRGASRYQGKECRRCKSTERYVTSSTCCQCQHDRNLRDRQRIATLQHAARVRLANEAKDESEHA
jgi:hypothetical protein